MERPTIATRYQPHSSKSFEIAERRLSETILRFKTRQRRFVPTTADERIFVRVQALYSVHFRIVFMLLSWWFVVQFFFNGSSGTNKRRNERTSEGREGGRKNQRTYADACAFRILSAATLYVENSFLFGLRSESTFLSIGLRSRSPSDSVRDRKILPTWSEI